MWGGGDGGPPRGGFGGASSPASSGATRFGAGASPMKASTGSFGTSQQPRSAGFQGRQRPNKADHKTTAGFGRRTQPVGGPAWGTGATRAANQGSSSAGGFGAGAQQRNSFTSRGFAMTGSAFVHAAPKSAQPFASDRASRGFGKGITQDSAKSFGFGAPQKSGFGAGSSGFGTGAQKQDTFSTRRIQSQRFGQPASSLEWDRARQHTATGGFNAQSVASRGASAKRAGFVKQEAQDQGLAGERRKSRSRSPQAGAGDSYAGPTDLFVRVKGPGNDDDVLYSLFSRFGKVTNVAAVPAKGWAYVTMKDHGGARAAVSQRQLQANGSTYTIDWNKQVARARKQAESQELPKGARQKKGVSLSKSAMLEAKKQELKRRLLEAQRKRDMLRRQAQRGEKQSAEQEEESEGEEEDPRDPDYVPEDGEDEDEDLESDAVDEPSDAHRGALHSSREPKPEPRASSSTKLVQQASAQKIKREPEHAAAVEGRTGFLVGRCMAKCPAVEIEKRYTENAVHLLERTHPEMPHLPLRDELMVKSFMRSSAGLKLDIPEIVRPEKVLVLTLDYLWDEILDVDAKGMDPRFRDSHLYKAGDSESPTPAFIFAFLSDRTRSVRKDFSLQGYLDDGGPLSASCIRVFEECARLHIMADQLLCESSKDEGHDETLNRQEANNCLKALNGLYSRARRSSCDAASLGSLLRNEAEFRAYYLILQCGDVFSIANYLKETGREIIRSPWIQVAVRIVAAYRGGNYVSFFRALAMESTPYLIACLMHGLLTRVWREALMTMNSTSYPGGDVCFSFEGISRLLMFEDAYHAQSFCEYLNLPLSEDGFHVVMGKKKSLGIPESAFPRRVMRSIEIKRLPSPPSPDDGGVLQLPPRAEVVRGVQAGVQRAWVGERATCKKTPAAAFAATSRLSPGRESGGLGAPEVDRTGDPGQGVSKKGVAPIKNEEILTTSETSMATGGAKAVGAGKVLERKDGSEPRKALAPPQRRTSQVEREASAKRLEMVKEEERQRLRATALAQQAEARRLEMARAQAQREKERREQLAREQAERTRREAELAQQKNAERAERMRREEELRKLEVERRRMVEARRAAEVALARRREEQRTMYLEDCFSRSSEKAFRAHQKRVRAIKRVWWRHWVKSTRRAVASRIRVENFRASLKSHLADGSLAPRIRDRAPFVEPATRPSLRQIRKLEWCKRRVSQFAGEMRPERLRDGEEVDFEMLVSETLARRFIGAERPVPWKSILLSCRVPESPSPEVAKSLVAAELWVVRRLSMTGCVRRNNSSGRDLLACFSKDFSPHCEILVSCEFLDECAASPGFADALVCLVPHPDDDSGDEYWSQTKARIESIGRHGSASPSVLVLVLPCLAKNACDLREDAIRSRLGLRGASRQVFVQSLAPEFQEGHSGQVSDAEVGSVVQWLVCDPKCRYYERIGAVMATDEFLLGWWKEIVSYGVAGDEQDACFYNLAVAPPRLKRWVLDCFSEALQVPLSRLLRECEAPVGIGSTSHKLKECGLAQGIRALCNGFTLDDSLRFGVGSLSLGDYFSFFMSQMPPLLCTPFGSSTACWNQTLLCVQQWVVCFNSQVEMLAEKVRANLRLSWPSEEFLTKLGLPIDDPWNGANRTSRVLGHLRECAIHPPVAGGGNFADDVFAFVLENVGDTTHAFDFLVSLPMDILGGEMITDPAGDVTLWNSVLRTMIDWKSGLLQERDLVVFDRVPSNKDLTEWRETCRPHYKRQLDLQQSESRASASESNAAPTCGKRQRFQENAALVLVEEESPVGYDGDDTGLRKVEHELSMEFKSSADFESLLQEEMERGVLVPLH